MWSLIIIITTLHGVGVTHVDNFGSQQLCKNAAVAVGKYASNGSWMTSLDKIIETSCVLEIN